MTNLVVQTQATENPPDLARQIEELETQLAERQVELAALQGELREFRERYTQTVGGRLAELAEVEEQIRQAEARLSGEDLSDEDANDAEDSANETGSSASLKSNNGSLRKLFWSVAKMFHPDHASDETEARRRHEIMATASRAYEEGDVERLNDLLGDDELHFYCQSAQGVGDEEDLPTRLLNLKEELRTVEYGIKRVKLDGMYKLKLSAERDAGKGRDALAEMQSRVNKQIKQAKFRLDQLTIE